MLLLYNIVKSNLSINTLFYFDYLPEEKESVLLKDKMRSAHFNLQDDQSSERKMLEFKSNEDQMYEMNKFVDEVLMDAQAQAQQQSDAREVCIFKFLLCVYLLLENL